MFSLVKVSMMASSSVPGRKQGKPVKLLAQEPDARSGLVQSVPLALIFQSLHNLVLSIFCSSHNLVFNIFCSSHNCFSTALDRSVSVYRSASTQAAAWQCHITGETRASLRMVLWPCLGFPVGFKPLNSFQCPHGAMTMAGLPL